MRMRKKDSKRERCIDRTKWYKKREGQNGEEERGAQQRPMAERENRWKCCETGRFSEKAESVEC